ncbi:hypothetical protein FB451DRAFT_1167821 [Mycena latifolia]|nr:hypothetical protein FB451DRAFT_1167821 [Mycena latifolia]
MGGIERINHLNTCLIGIPLTPRAPHVHLAQLRAPSTTTVFSVGVGVVVVAIVIYIELSVARGNEKRAGGKMIDDQNRGNRLSFRPMRPGLAGMHRVRGCGNMGDEI